MVIVWGMKPVNARLIPKDLNCLQTRRLVQVAKEMLDNVAEDSTFIKHIFTGDETWLYGYVIETVVNNLVNGATKVSRNRKTIFAESTEDQSSRSL